MKNYLIGGGAAAAEAFGLLRTCSCVNKVNNKYVQSIGRHSA
jgi:hypothetical protein